MIFYEHPYLYSHLLLTMGFTVLLMLLLHHSNLELKSDPFVLEISIHLSYSCSSWEDSDKLNLPISFMHAVLTTWTYVKSYEVMQCFTILVTFSSGC